MTDQTPVTDDDRRKAHAQCDEVENNPTSYEDDAHAIARAIRAHVPAPPKSLADELRKIIIDLEHHDMDSSPDGRGTWQVLDATASLRDLADRAKQIEQERDHFFREVENVRTWKEQLLNERDEALAELERLTLIIKNHPDSEYVFSPGGVLGKQAKENLSDYIHEPEEK